MALVQDHERRQTPRYPVRMRVVCDDGLSYTSATVEDLSPDGMFLRTPRTLPAGARVSLVPLGPVGELVFALDARVVRIEPDIPGIRPGMGVRLELDPNARTEYEALLAGSVS